MNSTAEISSRIPEGELGKIEKLLVPEHERPQGWLRWEQPMIVIGIRGNSVWIVEAAAINPKTSGAHYGPHRIDMKVLDSSKGHKVQEDAPALREFPFHTLDRRLLHRDDARRLANLGAAEEWFGEVYPVSVCVKIAEALESHFS